MTTFITIIAFTQYSHDTIGYEAEWYAEVKNWLVLSMGILGLLSTILMSWMINTRYQSYHDMHALAERTLSKICQSIRFPDSKNGIIEHLNTQKAVYLAVSYTTEIPPKILRAFRDLEHIMCTKPYTFKAIQYERFYYALWKSFTKGRYLWPCKISEVNVSKLEKLIGVEFTKYNKGMEDVAAAKVQNNLVMRRMSSSSPVRSSTRGRSTNCDSTDRTDSFNNSDGERSTLLHVSTRSAGSSTAAEV